LKTKKEKELRKNDAKDKVEDEKRKKTKNDARDKTEDEKIKRRRKKND
jgi:hypothetical protein